MTPRQKVGPAREQLLICLWHGLLTARLSRLYAYPQHVIWYARQPTAAQRRDRDALDVWDLRQQRGPQAVRIW